MGNDCWNQLTITCENSADELNNLITNEIQYKQNDEHDESVHNEHVRIIARGKHGIKVDMYTKWQPDFEWLTGLLDKYPNCWVKNQWDEEGGMAGVWVGFVDQSGKKQVQEMCWRDLCIEEKVYFFKDAADASIL
jgi:hypothetical protein